MYIYLFNDLVLPQLQATAVTDVMEGVGIGPELCAAPAVDEQTKNTLSLSSFTVTQPGTSSYSI